MTLVSKIKRNTRVLEEIANATDFRIAFKTADGWKRLRLPAAVASGVRYGASKIVSDRLDKLVPAAVDAALNGLVDELNDR